MFKFMNKKTKVIYDQKDLAWVIDNTWDQFAIFITSLFGVLFLALLVTAVFAVSVRAAPDKDLFCSAWVNITPTQCDEMFNALTSLPIIQNYTQTIVQNHSYITVENHTVFIEDKDTELAIKAALLEERLNQTQNRPQGMPTDLGTIILMRELGLRPDGNPLETPAQIDFNTEINTRLDGKLSDYATRSYVQELINAKQPQDEEGLNYWAIAFIILIVVCAGYYHLELKNKEPAKPIEQVLASFQRKAESKVQDEVKIPHEDIRKVNSL